MTAGQLMFYAGIALLVLTVLLAVIFLVKKPMYDPERAAYSPGTSQTQKLRNGYPTARLTIRRERPESAVPNTAALEYGTEQITEMQSEGSQTAAVADDVLLERQSDGKSMGTLPLAEVEDHHEPQNETVLLESATEADEKGTALLTCEDSSCSMEEPNETVML